MFRPPRTSKNEAVIALLGAFLHLCSSASAQNYTLQVAEVTPFGLTGLGSGEKTLTDLGLENGIKGDLSYGASLNSAFDTNFSLREEDPDSEFSVILAPWIRYNSDPEGGAPVAFTANYSAAARTYWHNSDFNDVDQSGGGTLTFTGSKSVISLNARYNELAGVDRLTGAFVNGYVLNTGIQGSHQIAPRTALFGGLTTAMSDYETGGVVGAQVYTGEIGGIWDATERFSIGPSVRYSLTESDNTGNEDAWGLLLNTRYRVGERIQLYGSIGLEYVSSSRDDGGSSFRPTGVVSASYAFTERLAWSNSIRYSTIPSPTETNYSIQNFAISTELSRQLTWGSLSAGLDLNFSDYQEVGAVTTSQSLEQNYSTYLSYRRKFFLDRVNFDSKIRYTVNDGSVDWDQVQISAGFDVQF